MVSVPPPELPVTPMRAGIHFREAREVIDAADAIPNEVARKVLPEQRFLKAGHGVLAVGILQQILILQEVPVLIPFALPHGIVTQDDVAPLRQPNEEVLVNVVGFAVLGMSARGEDGGKRSFARGRHIEVGGHIVFRQAFENDLANQVALARNLAGHARVKRRMLGGQPADEVQKGFAVCLLPNAEIGFRLDLVEPRQALLGGGLRQFLEIVRHHLRHAPLRDLKVSLGKGSLGGHELGCEG